MRYRHPRLFRMKKPRLSQFCQSLKRIFTFCHPFRESNLFWLASKAVRLQEQSNRYHWYNHRLALKDLFPQQCCSCKMDTDSQLDSFSDRDSHLRWLSIYRRKHRNTWNLERRNLETECKLLRYSKLIYLAHSVYNDPWKFLRRSNTRGHWLDPNRNNRSTLVKFNYWLVNS